MFLKKTFYMLPLRDSIIFPASSNTIVVARQKSVAAVEKAYENKELIFAITQKDFSDDIINENTIYSVGVLSKIIQKITLPDGSIRIVIEGQVRAKLKRVVQNDNYFCADVQELKNYEGNKKENQQLLNALINRFKEYLDNYKKFPVDIVKALQFITTTDETLFYICALLPLNIDQRQKILEERVESDRIKRVFELLENEIAILDTEKKITSEMDKNIFKYQKKMYLNEKLKAIKKELGDDVDEDTDINSIGYLKKKVKELELSEEAKTKVEAEIKRLEVIPQMSPEYGVAKNFVEWILDLPWGIKSTVKNDLKIAKKILERDHYGLKEVKERILEFLAVYKKTKSLKGPIICLYGPPGVGKTSLARSIAEALNRKYIKISLGGMRDEAEIRGHRRTYVGSMPGKIVQSLKKVGVSNPLILLDEIDKMSADFRGDPASALLEALDPEQNKNFNDHYLEIDIDLSDVLFITTANNLSEIPIPLRDRMEIIKISGYTEDEKLNIAKKYLIPREMKNHGITKTEFSITDDTILEIIREYTFEAGVRNLQRELAKIIRKCTKNIVEKENSTKEKKKIEVTLKTLKKYLGIPKFSFTRASEKNKVGVTTGLAYTDFGGDLLYIEALKFSGSGKLIITGKLGDVMKESVQAAFSYVRSQASRFGITEKEFNKYDFHVHVPEGATPKDGPSAGVAISSALMSAVTGMEVRKDFAMTGEITLTGRVLAIGGLKEKLMAALRGGIKSVIIPKENVKNLEEIPDKIKKNLEIKPVEKIEEALSLLLIGWNDKNKKATLKTVDKNSKK